METDRSEWKRESDDGEEEEGEGWLTSYSDLMTDLLAIFVILYAFAMMQLKIYKTDMTPQATNAATMSTPSVLQGGQGILPEQLRFNSLFDAISSYILDTGLIEQLGVVKQGDGTVLLRMADSALFDSGQAVIKPQALELLSSVSTILTEYADFIRMVRIEGHTDNRPINTSQFNSNWELSTTRAVNVLKKLLDKTAMGPEKFSAVGYSEYHPIAENDTAQGRSLNRRVDFIIETIIE